MNFTTPREIISNIHEIGSLPQSLAAVLQVLNNHTAGADEIADTISKDVSLTTRVLKMVNSAQYSRHRKVTKVSEAVIVMGLNSIKMLTLSSSVFGMMPDSELMAKCDIKRIWRHLIETATSARSVAKSIRYREPEEAFVAGILHDIGIIIMLLHFKEKYFEVIESIKIKKCGLIEAEKETFGYTHADVGAEMINAWKLPSKLAFVVKNHHSPNEPGVIADDITLNGIVALADRLTLGPFDEYFPDIEESVLFINALQQRLKLRSEETNRIRKESLSQSIMLAQYLELDVGDIIDILTEANDRLAQLYFWLEKLYLEKHGTPVSAISAQSRTIARSI